MHDDEYLSDDVMFLQTDVEWLDGTISRKNDQ